MKNITPYVVELLLSVTHRFVPDGMKVYALAIIGMVALSASLIGYLAAPTTLLDRLMLFVGGIMMIDPGTATDIAGIILFVLVLLTQKRRKTAAKK